DDSVVGRAGEQLLVFLGQITHRETCRQGTRTIMNGYWVGPYAGSHVGRLVLEVDDMGNHFEGCAYAYDSNVSLPSTFAVIKTSDKANRLQMKAPLFPLHPQTGEPTDWRQIADLYSNQNIKVPKEAEVECEWDSQNLTLSWRTDVETFGSA